MGVGGRDLDSAKITTWQDAAVRLQKHVNESDSRTKLIAK